MTPQELLEDLSGEYGTDAMEAMIGYWLAKSHRERPRLFWSKPEGAAKAPHYLEFVRQQNCCRCGAEPRVDPDHIGPRGLSQKTDDYRTIPLCRRCHDLRQTGKLPEFDWKHHMVNTLIRYLRIVEQR